MKKQEPLETIRQALMEFYHALEVGPNWYTHADRGMWDHIRMWNKRGHDAIESIEKERKMRINIYEEELGEGVEVIQKDNVNGNETFYGLRVWLKSPKEILEHSTPDDDDRCAITFWAKDKQTLMNLVFEMDTTFGE